MKSLAKTIKEVGLDATILNAIQDINYRQKQILLDRLIARLGDDLSGKTVAVWGLAFKPNTDDVRNAPSLEVVSKLIEEKATVNCHDPQATNQFKKAFNQNSNINFYDDMYESVRECDALIILTEWPDYLSTKLGELKDKMNNPLIVDGRGIFKPSEIQKSGFEYKAFGLKENNN